MCVLKKRRWIRFAFLAAAILTCRQGAAQRVDSDRRSLDAEFWASVDAADVILPCKPGSEDAERAAEAIRELDERVSGLELGDDHEPIARSILALLRTPCFHMAKEVDRLPRPDSAESLKRWWEDGGSSWLYSYVELPKEGPIDDMRPYIVIPPDDRPTLSRRTRKGWQLGPLLCEETDLDCQAHTEGWRRRAEEAIERPRENRQVERLYENGWRWTSVSAHDVVAEAARKACLDWPTAPLEYKSFHDCVEDVSFRRRALPLGAIRAPDSGWLLVAGRRGHYDYCDEVNAYNLANGDAFRARRCSDLVLDPEGAVDVTATERRAAEEVEVGTLNVENLREAAWMLLISQHMEELRARASFVELPRDLDRRIDAGVREPAPFFVEGFGGSTAQTSLVWSISHPDYGADGELVWPFSYDPSEEHGTRLLETAESSWREHCPAAPPSSAEILRLYPGVHGGDADINLYEKNIQRLKSKIADWSRGACSDQKD